MIETPFNNNGTKLKFDYIDSNILEIKKRIGKYSWQRRKKRDLLKV